MVTFDDIKAVYSSTSDSEINRTYTERQKENRRLNNEIAKEVFFEFPSEIISMPSDMSDSEKVSYLISLFLNSGNKRLIKIVLEILKKYNYNNFIYINGYFYIYIFVTANTAITNCASIGF